MQSCEPKSNTSLRLIIDQKGFDILSSHAKEKSWQGHKRDMPRRQFNSMHAVVHLVKNETLLKGCSIL